jgi:hypothetical protein
MVIFGLLGTFLKELIGKWWWQIPVVVTTIITIGLWDHQRIARHVTVGKEQVRTDFRKANDKAVVQADKIRSKAGTPATKGIVDPHTIGLNQE